MATLADVLRQGGYIQDNQIVRQPSTTAQSMNQYGKNVIQNAAQNLAQQRSDIDAGLVMGDQGVQIGDKAAFERQILQVPSVAGTTNLWSPRKMGEGYENAVKKYFVGPVKDELDDVLRTEMATYIVGAGDALNKQRFKEVLKQYYADDTLGQAGYSLKDALKRVDELVKQKTINFRPARKEIIEEQIKKIEK
jgi:hypothetical protein